MLGPVTRPASVLKTVGCFVWAALPALAVATLIPLFLFYVVLLLGTVDIAIAVQVVYAYSAGLWQYRKRRRVSGMLMVTMFMVTVRVVALTLSGRPFFYFLAPVIETVGFGLLFMVSLLTRESLIVRLARDVVPDLADQLAERVGLCRGLSAVWALAYIGSGMTTFLLLVTQPLPIYLAAHQLTGWAWSGSAIVTSVGLCRWRARGLFSFAMARRGRPARSVPAALDPVPDGPVEPMLPLVALTPLSA
jgi:intracellular septation protein A